MKSEVNSMTERERIDTQLATLYDLRLQVMKEEKESYTREEVLALFDTVALEKQTK